MITRAEQIAVRALAHADALRLPLRDWSGHASANRTIGLPQLAAHGVPLRVGGDALTRKTGELVIQDAVDAGLIVRTAVRRSKWPFVRLTDRGEYVARALAGCPLRGGGLWALHTVAGLSRRKPKTFDELWVDEIALNNGKGWGSNATREERKALGETEQNALPAIAEGWLVADSTIRGHGRYAVAEPGWAELDTPSAVPDVGELPAEDAEASELYTFELNAKLAELQQTKPEQSGEVGAPALPVSHLRVPLVNHGSHFVFEYARTAAALRRRERTK